ncbi:arabinose transporter [Bosea sp. TAF32]|uniref:arabinose transporter n=1 Tax=Bosea sp. TAF32 TaxID=3237482 RepID=UPI003F915689
MVSSSVSSGLARSVAVSLLPIMAAVLTGFLVIGIALPVLPLHVNRDLGFGTVVVGLVAGAQFVAAVVTRIWSGSYADMRGGKRAVMLGLITAAASGLLYLMAWAAEGSPTFSVAILLAGRALLGGAESFIITGGESWGLTTVDARHAGKVIAWVGTAMFAALALGGPIGTTLFASHGFAAIGLATTLLPLIVFLGLLRVPAPHVLSRQARSSLRRVLNAVWLPGIGAALSSVGYGAILAFSSLLYSDHGWQPVWLAFTAFGVALIAARLVCGHLPDKLGGARVALLFVGVQTAGLLLMGLASNGFVASAGAALAGFGYSLVYPGFGVEAVRNSSPETRGLVIGIYTVFLDIAMAVGSPALGWVAEIKGLNAVFIAGAGVTLCAAAVGLPLLRSRRHISQVER